MSDMKLYKILENFDNLESATDKLTEYNSNAECYDCGSTISGHHTKLCDLAGPAAIRDLPAREGSQHWTGEVPRGLENQVGTWDNTNVPDVDESQTKVQSMGNRVKVTTDGDTTEFDDAETAAAFMGDGDDDNQFATEEKQPFWFKDRSPKERKKAERKLDRDAKKDADIFGSDEKDDDYNDTDVDESKETAGEKDARYWKDEKKAGKNPTAKKGTPGDNDDSEQLDEGQSDKEKIKGLRLSAKASNLSATARKQLIARADKLQAKIDKKEKVNEGSPPARKGELNTPENQMLVGLIQQHFPDDDENDIWNWLVSAADFGEPLTVEEYSDYRAFGEDGIVKETGAGCMEDDGPEFATFDSENESHRKRLQRGTPVVLDADLFTDSNVNRRGVFVNRSTSGFTGTVIRDLDGKEINVHLSDIKSADLVNNSIYEEFDLNFEAMLAEDEDEKKQKWGVFSKGGSIGSKGKDKPVATYDERADAMDDAKRRRKSLTKGEKSYYGMGYSVKKINEDITMTQTTNLENPENDTTTVTAVGNDAGEELAAMMANAGLNTGEYASMDAPPIDAGEVDTGEPTVEPVQMGMGDMIGMMDEPEAMESEYDPTDTFTNDEFGMSDPQASSLSEYDPTDTFTNGEPSNTDLDAIDSDPEWELDFEETAEPIREDDIAYLTQEIAQAIVDGADIYDLIHDESVPQKDREGLQRDIDELMLGGDNELTAYENLAQRIYDMYADADLGEARDIERANTPNEIVAGVDMITHGTSGGLNRPKRMHKPAAGGDNAMQRPMEVEEALSPEMQRQKELDQEKIRVDRDMSRSSKGSRLRDRGRGTGRHDRSIKFGLGEDEVDEELSPEMQAQKERDQERIRKERDWSRSSRRSGSRLTGKGRGTGGHARSSFAGISEEKKEWKKPWEDEDVVDADEDGIPGDIEDNGNEIGDADKEEVDENKLVNEHESVDSFLDLYKEFTIRTDKK